MKDNTFFSAEGLTVGYNGKALISDISINLKKGEILTLIGPNGAGKSTILKSITRQLAAIAGVVYIDSKDVKAMSGRDIAKKMAVVLTDRVRPELMTCGEIVASGRYPYTNSFGRLTEKDDRIVLDALRRVDAEELYDRDFLSTSDGQKQRIMLARAIAQEPEIIVLDEPTSYLDIKYKIELLSILSDMAKKQNITVVMSLHEIDLASKISDKIICVKGEKIAGYGTPEDIFTDSVISCLYDLEKGSYNSLLGSAELPKPPGIPETFVIGGAGYGIRIYRELQKAYIPFSCGILFENDIDYAVAKPLAAETVSAGAFSPIGEQEIIRAKEIIDSVPYVIDSGCPAGEFNRANDELRKYAGVKLKKEAGL